MPRRVKPSARSCPRVTTPCCFRASSQALLVEALDAGAVVHTMVWLSAPACSALPRGGGGVAQIAGLEGAEAVEAGGGAARVEQGFLALEEAGGEEGVDGGGDLGGVQSLGQRLELRFCRALVTDQ